MAPRDNPSKDALATLAVAGDVDPENGNRDHDRIAPSASSQSIPFEGSSKLDPPAVQTGLEVVDNAEHQRHPHGAPQWIKKMEGKLPRPIVRVRNTVVQWVKGPQPPRIYRIAPLFERWQTLPVRLLGRFPRWVRVCIYGIAFILWAVGFGVVLSDYSLPLNFAGAGPPVRLDCNDNLWPSAQICGLDGQNCLPFSDSSFAFNCPAACLSTQVLNPRSIGSTIINYQSFVVGGTPNQDPAYRGDSFVCGAAIHAGVISNGKGGCGVLSLKGEKSRFGAVDRNGISSVAFDAAFPMSFVFKHSPAIQAASSKCSDPRWNLLILSTIFTAIFGLFTSNPATFFAPVFTILFFQIGMASDPPAYTTYASLASTIIGRFLPAAMAAALFYQWSVRRTLRNCKANVEKTILWVGGAWVGALDDSTLSKIPIQRLTGHDIRQQPGAITALIIIVLVLFAIMLYQGWCFRNEGRLPRLLAIYAILGIGLGILSALPKLNLRIHHYIIALLLLPGTAIQTRPSLLFQGLLAGLFVNGTARWGFDAVLQTAAALRGDAQLGSAIPSVFEPVINGSTIAFAWKAALRGYDGVSVLVNDVERFRGGLGGSGNQSSFSWTRQAAVGSGGEDAGPDYFRFGFVSYQPFGGVSYSDFTRAGTWWPNGTWAKIPPGRT